MRRVTVFCGSSYGTDQIFKIQARQLGEKLAKQGIEVVYGGAKVGLMEAVADEALKNGGKVIGVLPNFLKSKEIAHENLTELILVETMHERKSVMNELCDGFITMPGGFGTIEELFEVITWAQLGLHKKPVALLNIDAFFDPLLDFIQAMVEKGFLKEVNQKMILSGDNIDELLEKMANYVPPLVEKWIR